MRFVRKGVLAVSLIWNVLVLVGGIVAVMTYYVFLPNSASKILQQLQCEVQNVDVSKQFSPVAMAGRFILFRHHHKESGRNSYLIVENKRNSYSSYVYCDASGKMIIRNPACTFSLQNGKESSSVRFTPALDGVKGYSLEE